MTLDESLLRSWSNFGSPDTCSMFSRFVDNGSDRGSLESQTLEMTL